MKPFEFIWLGIEPFLLPLHKEMRHRLLRVTRDYPQRPEILDVGGRKSHCTIGIPGMITVSDLPRQSEIQHRLTLGINDDVIEQTLRRRSNIRQMIFDDMTRSSFLDQSFDFVFAVEVLEHVEEDARFVSEVHRVLKPGGVFLMSTPNGDSIRNTNPDHKRHYKRDQLRALLDSIFEQVEVEYAIQGGTYRRLGLQSWSVSHPLRTGLSMAGNVINSIQSGRPGIKARSSGTHHLIAIAKKQN